jgi:predicted PurR-regulated permease PerM
MNQIELKKQSVRGHIVFVFAMALALYIAWVLRGTLMLLFVSALLAVVLSPIVRATSRLKVGSRRPFQGSVAVFILLLAVAGALTGFGFLAFPPVIRDLESLSTELPSRLPILVSQLHQIPFANRLDTGDLLSWIQSSLSSAAEYTLLSLKTWAGAVVKVIAGFVLTLYFLVEGEVAYRWFLSFVPHRPRLRLDQTLRRAAVRMQKWLLGQLALMLILGVLSTIVYLSLHIRYASALGILTGLFNVVPVLGAIVSFILAALTAAADSWGRVLGIVIFYAVYFQFENAWLSPRIMRTRVHLPALGVFVALLLGSELGGIPGALISIPTAVLVSVLLNEYLVQKDEVQKDAEAEEGKETGKLLAGRSQR